MRRLVNGLAALLFLVALGVWLVSMPGPPTRIYQAVPAGVSLVAVCDQPAAHWEAALANPLTRLLVRSTGLKPGDLEQLGADPAFRAWLDRLGGGLGLIAYQSATARHGESHWGFAVWLGGRAQRLRWLLGLPGRGPAQALGRYHGRMLWRWRADHAAGEPDVFFAFAEGMLVGVIAQSDGPLRQWLDSLDGRYPRADLPLAEATPRPLWGAWRLAPGSHWQGWITTFDAAATQGVLEGSAMTAPGTPPAERQPEREADLARLFGRLPVALVRAPTPLWEAALSGDWAIPLRPVVRQALQMLEAEEVVAVLLANEYGGSLRGIRLPMLVLAVPSPGPAAAQQGIARLMDQLNRNWGWGLVPGPLPERTTGLPPAFSIEATTGGFYGGLPPAERVAYAVTAHWLLLASNANGLTALLRRYPTPAAVANARHAPWTADQPGQPPLGAAWADWPRVAQAGRQALGAYMLKLLFEDPEGSRLLRARLQDVLDWLQTLAPLGTGRLRLTGAARWQVAFEMQSELETAPAPE